VTEEDPRARKRRRQRRIHWVEAVVIAVVVVAIGAGVAWAARSLTSGTPVVPEASATVTPAATSTPPSEPATSSTEPTAAVTASDTIRIAAVGDLLFDLGPRGLIAAKGGAAPLAKVASILRAADLTIANLETTLSRRGPAVGGKPANLIFNGDPRGILSITTAGIDIVDQANNHAMDHGAIALKDTINTLDKAGVLHTGAGLNKAAAWKPVYTTVKGVKVAFLAATQIVPAHFTPTATRAGVAVGKPITRLVAAVRAARKKADVVIVSVHWGIEQNYSVTAAQKSGARALINAGADMVLSHHPHVMEGIDFYKGKLIAYSLGNFLFPYKTNEGRKSFILRFDYGPKKGVTNITATPVYLGQWGRPVVQTGASARSILGKLAKISKPFGTKLTIRNGIGYITPR
jgi:poly-gamma-glutamate synthesis protein (capsule biosynthesis protein)